MKKSALEPIIKFHSYLAQSGLLLNSSLILLRQNLRNNLLLILSRHPTRRASLAFCALRLGLTSENLLLLIGQVPALNKSNKNARAAVFQLLPSVVQGAGNKDLPWTWDLFKEIVVSLEQQGIVLKEENYIALLE